MLKRRLAAMIVNHPISQAVLARREIGDLRKLPAANCDVSTLLAFDAAKLSAWIDPAGLEAEWQAVAAELAKFAIPDGTGGINLGDRRAVYYLVRRLRPKAVLEIGTHIGASTVHISAALRACRAEDGSPRHLMSVNVRDVNSERDEPWRNYGMQHSPADMVRLLGLGADAVHFVRDTSLGFAAKTNQKFDFIFLDGDHAAPTVYTEIAVAMSLLNPGGVILLHDYFPNCEPIWSNGSVIVGPFLAVERFRAGGVPIRAFPLGALAWPTKLGSKMTSLALLGKSH
jgi:predicted O-methyltransferase YrrM